jgi:hypothetical protein
MKKTAISTLIFGFSMTCLPLISSALEPLKQTGKTTLYQRVLSTPTCELKKNISDAIGQSIPAFSRYYVYERKNENNQEWLNVGPDSYGKTVGWINNSCAVAWNMQLTLVFTNPVERDPLLFFKDRASLSTIVDADKPETLIKPIRDALKENKTAPQVVAQEPKEFIDFKSNFYLLPILQGEEVMNGQGFYERILEVASVSKQETVVKNNNKSTNLSTDNNAIQVVPFKAAIVFVIDSTISMDPYISRTKEAVERVYQQIEKEHLQDQVKFGLISFRSSLKASDKLEFVSKVFADPNKVKNKDDFKKLSASLKQASVSTAYFAEDSYAGVSQALNDINWNSFGARYMILITDASAIPGDDKLSSTGMDAAQLRLEAQHKGVAIYALHLKTKSGEKDHQVAAAQYSDLTYNDFIHKSLYYPVNAGDVNEFGKKVDSLAQALSEQVKLAYKGESSVGNALNAKDDDNSNMLKDALLLSKAMQLAYLGDTKGTKAPTVFKAWIADKDFVKPTIPTAEPRILLTKSQLSDLSDIVTKIANAANDGLISADDMFSQLRSVAAAMGQDPNKLKSDSVTKIADLGLLGEYLDNIPYKSDVTGLDQETWKSMSGIEQEKFIRNLNSKVRYYQKCNADVDRWISLSEGSDPRENVYPVPLEMLP